jgi:hypothetical protein
LTALGKRFMTALLLLAFAGAPSLARAGTINTAPSAPAAVAELPGEPPASSAPATAPGETADYAAREAAAPELGKFQGGSVVVITGGTLLIVLLIVLIVLVL